MQNKRLIRFQVALKRQQKEILVNMACTEGVSLSEVVRRAIDQAIRKEKLSNRFSAAGAWSAQTETVSLHALRKERRIFKNG
jgi:hypothetical protein